MFKLDFNIVFSQKRSLFLTFLITFFCSIDSCSIPAAEALNLNAICSATPSLNSFIRYFEPNLVYKLIGRRNGKVGVKVTLPHYIVMFI